MAQLFEYAYTTVTDWGDGNAQMAVHYPGMSPDLVMGGEDPMTMLARMGGDGWELVTVDSEQVHQAGGVARINTFWFKRPRD